MPTEEAKSQQPKTTNFWNQAHKIRQNQNPTCIDQPKRRRTADRRDCKHVGIAYHSTSPVMEEETNEWFRATCHTEGVAIRTDGY